MPNNENNNTIITDLKFGNNIYEIGLGTTTSEELESIFEDINSNFEDLNNTIEDNEETVSSSLNDLESRKADKVDIPIVPTNVSAFTNDAGYLTQHQSLTDYATKEWVEGKNYLTQHQDISAYFNDVEYDSNSKRINFKNGNTVKKYIDTTDFIKDGMVDTVTVGEVTIDNVLTRCLIITFNTDSGKEDINIPLTYIFNSNEYYTKSDIDATDKVVANSLVYLNNQITNLSEIVTTIPNITNTIVENSMDGVTSGAVYKVITENEKTISSSLNDLQQNKANKTNVYTKTETDAKYATQQALNTVETNKSDKIPVVNHGTSDTTFTLTPNVYHIWGTVTSLTLTLGTATGYYDEYMFEFESGTTATTLSLPSTIKWQDNPTVEPNKIYQVSIVNNLGLMIGVNS